MLVNIDDEFYETITALSEVLDITPGDYLEKQHDSNTNLKGVLLSEKEEFMKFIEDYKRILDELFFLSDDALQSLSKVDDSIEMKRVFSRLNTLVGEDVGFITKLYMVYKEKELIG